ncbi:MAG: hypothetical protein JRF33_06125 [Deltaproteobacteria bacterium]|nr:hypothetical protein [Deltaproteobacteria bacterium]
MRKILSVVFVLILASVGCNKEENKKEGASGELAAAGASTAAKGGGMFGAFDPAAELKALNGKWKVKDNAFGKEPSLWEISGAKVKVTRGDKIIEGELEIKHPGQLALVEKSAGGSSRTYYAYARSAADVYIGLGKAGVKVGDTYYVAADDGVVIKSKDKCQFLKKKMFGGFEGKAVDVKCEIKEEGGKQLLSYETPKRFKEGEMNQGKVQVLGEALLNEQMMGHKAEKAP